MLPEEFIVGGKAKAGGSSVRPSLVTRRARTKRLGLAFTGLMLILFFAVVILKNGIILRRPEPQVASRDFAAAIAGQQKQLTQLIDAKERVALSSQLAVDREAPDAPPSSSPLTQPMVAKTVSLVIVTKDFPASRDALARIVAKYQGYAAQMTVNTEQNSPQSLDCSLRIPADRLASSLEEIKRLGVEQTETQNGEEVTEQHTDLVARLKNARETEDRLLAILRDRSGKVSDVLAVEQEISRVRGEVEQMEAEQKSLEKRVQFAQVELKLTQEYRAAISGEPSVWTQLRNAAVEGYKMATHTVMGIVLFFVEFGPSLLIWALLLALPVRWAWKRWKQWMTNKSPVVPETPACGGVIGLQ
jgi:hypothetical protein